MDAVRPWLWIGSLDDTYDSEQLIASGIDVVLQLAGPVDQPGIEIVYLPVEDAEPVPPDVLAQGIDFVLDRANAGQRVMIACFAGINRSPTFAIAVLMTAEGLGLWDAFVDVQSRHPDALPDIPLWQSLCDYFGEQIPYDTVWKYLLG